VKPAGSIPNLSSERHIPSTTYRISGLEHFHVLQFLICLYFLELKEFHLSVVTKDEYDKVVTLSRDGEMPSLKVFGVWKIYKFGDEEAEKVLKSCQVTSKTV